MNRIVALVCAWVMVAIGLTGGATAQVEVARGDRDVRLDAGLGVHIGARWGRRAINTDALVRAIAEGVIGDPAKGLPKAGEVFPPLMPGEVQKLDAGEREVNRWYAVRADDAGGFTNLKRDDVLAVHVRSAQARVMVLEASGHAMVYVNGQARMGDPYSHGYVRTPVKLQEGDNLLLFVPSGRGGIKAALRAGRGSVEINDGDLTTPDVLAGVEGKVIIGIPVLNLRDEWTRVRVDVRGATEKLAGSVEMSLPPLGMMKSPVEIPIEAKNAGEKVTLTLFAGAEGGEESDRRECVLNVVSSSSRRKITIQSRVDGSVQYYAVVPATGTPGAKRPGLVLSLHGASVEATNQAASYAPKEDLVIVCPTNRRPFGFDWEDWGRIDAIEVLENAAKEFGTEPRRQYLTGHSMGGHGTWQLGVLYPERFAAIAPSAGWLSFETYLSSRGDLEKSEDRDRIEDVLRDATRSSDTLAMMSNLRGGCVYILHGDADENVPVREARTARDALTKLKIDFGYHEQPGAGHWWDDSEETPGAACVDWRPIFEMFATCELNEAAPAPAIKVPLDDRGFSIGSFKRALDRRFVMVVGTGGTPEENAWALAKARFDGEQWWYRGNGRAEIVRDTEFDVRDYAGRNVVLYGHAQMNAAWAAVMGTERRVKRGMVEIDGRDVRGEDVGVLLLREHGSGQGSWIGAAVCGTGMVGMRAIERVPLFIAGAGVSDVLILHARAWSEGTAGVEAAGPSGGVVWRQAKP